jgi:hypothetical protein
MPATKSIVLSLPHQLTQDEAKRRIQGGIANFRSQFAGQMAEVEEQWVGHHMDFRFSVAGQSVTGRVDVLSDVVRFDVDLPWIFAMIAERLRGRIQQEGQKLLERK